MPEYRSEDKAPVMFIELVEKQDSGFVRDGTENTPFEERLTAPSIAWIPSEGFRRRMTTNDKGEVVPTPGVEAIRFIRGVDEISVQRQKELGLEPTNKGKGDKIIFEKGFATVAREGADVGLYDYLKDVYYNTSNPLRSQKATGIFKVIEQDDDAEVFNDSDMIMEDVLAYTNRLQQKVGKTKDGKNLYKYNEEKIDGLCQYFNIFGESYAKKLQAIKWFSRVRPQEFLEGAVRWEQTTMMEVSHALQLNVIKFDGNVLMYGTKDKVIKNLGSEKMTKEQKIEASADWLRTSDGHEAYMELKAELDAAKEKQLKS